MELGPTIAGVSGGVLLLLLLLFAVEAKKGRRILFPRARVFLDAMLQKMSRVLTRLSPHMSAGSFRLLFHYVVHRMLSRTLRFLNWIASGIAKLQRKNKTIARAVRGEQEKTHLDIIADHKVETSLSDDEKRQMRSH